MASPLENCSCSRCATHAASVKRNPLYSATAEHAFPVEVLLGDHVVLRGEKTGHVRYLGHVDGVQQSEGVFVGIELDAPGECGVGGSDRSSVDVCVVLVAVGMHDGVANERRYFKCEPQCGVFVPFSELCCVITNSAPQEPPSQQPPPNKHKRARAHTTPQQSAEEVRD